MKTCCVLLGVLMMGYGIGFYSGVKYQKRYYWHPAAWSGVAINPPPYRCSLDGKIWWPSRADGTCYAADEPSPKE